MDDLQEIWKDVVGYEGNYQISSFGRVKSLSRIIKKSDGKVQTLKEKIMKSNIQRRGYEMVRLVGNKSEARTIHSIMGESFLNKDLRKKRLTVNHKNGIKTDNNLSNLEICTYSENSQHAYNNGIDHNFGEGNYNSKLKNAQVSEIKRKLRASATTHKTLKHYLNYG